MSTWYYTDAEQQRQGPLSTDELKQHFRREAIAADTLVWRDGMLHWRPLGELAMQLGLLPVPAPDTEGSPMHAPTTPRMPPPPPPPTPLALEPTSAPAEPAAAAATTAPVSGRAVFNLGSEPAEPTSPAFTEALRNREPAALDATQDYNPYRPPQVALGLHRSARARDEDVVYAGFWKRVAAAIVDSAIMGIVGAMGGEALGALLGDLVGGGEMTVLLMTALVTLALNACYFAFFHSAFNLATPGKMLIGIKVVRGNGEPISFWRGVARYFATIPSAILLCIGYLMAAFTDRKRALHDMICDTVVVDKWAYTRQPELQQHELGTATLVVLAGYVLLVVLVVVFAVALGLGAR